MRKQKSNTGLIVVLVVLIMLVLFWFCLFFLYKEGYLSLSKENKNNISLNNKAEEKNDDNKNIVNMKDIYNDLKNGKRTITTQNGVYSLDDYLNGKAFSSSILYSPEKYTYTDLDKDGIDELIVKLSKTDGFAIIHYEDNIVYGYYYIPLRGFRDLKEDGTYYASDSAYTTYIYNMTFNKNTYSDNVIMNYDKSNNKCVINNENKAMDDCDKYMLKQDEKTSINFEEYDQIDNAN